MQGSREPKAAAASKTPSAAAVSQAMSWFLVKLGMEHKAQIQGLHLNMNCLGVCFVVPFFFSLQTRWISKWIMTKKISFPGTFPGEHCPKWVMLFRAAESQNTCCHYGLSPARGNGYRLTPRGLLISGSSPSPNRSCRYKLPTCWQKKWHL